MSFDPVKEYGWQSIPGKGAGLVADWACHVCKKVIYPKTHVSDVPRGPDPCSTCIQAANRAWDLANEWWKLEGERLREKFGREGQWTYTSEASQNQGLYALRDDLARYVIHGEASKALTRFAKRLGKDLPGGAKLSGAGRREMKIDDLPHDMQSLLGQIALDSGGFPMKDDADFERFKKIKLPFFMLPLDAFPKEIQGQDPGDDRSFEDYLETNIEEYPPVVIAHGYWIDGRHRLWAARTRDVKEIQTIDASKIFGKKQIERWRFLGKMRK